MTKLDDVDDEADDFLEVRPKSADADLVRRVLEQRIARADIGERGRLSRVWLDRAIRVRFADALGDAGSLEAASIARTAPPLQEHTLRVGLNTLARIASAHPKRGDDDAMPDVDLAVNAIERAMTHARAVGADARELALVSSWIAKAMVALGLDSDDELRAQLDDLGGFSDA
jgi:hypothetical protein